MTARAENLRTWIEHHRLPWAISLVAVFCLLRAVQTVVWRRWFGSLDFPVSAQFVLFLAAWFVILAVGLVVGGIVRLPGTTWAQLGWCRRRLLKAVALGILGFVLLYINVIVWAIAKGSTEQPQMTMPGLGRLLLVAFFAFGQPAWVEENLYRGYLQPLLSQGMSLWPAIVAQAALFSLAHVGYLSNPFDFGQVFVAGLILGRLRGRNNSLKAPFLAHGLFWMMQAFMPGA